jgi:two-component system, chemotaxis family, chemotaxis protein CheY
LLVDDDDDVRTSLWHLLTDEGFTVHTARNGQEALARLREIEPPGLILLDLMMPVMDGTQFLAERSLDQRLTGIPVVIMSAWTKERRGRNLGVDAVLTKPISPELLLSLVERYCDRDERQAPQRR